MTLADCSQRFLTGYWINRDPGLSRRFIDADVSNPHRILLATMRSECHRREGKVLHVVSRKGVPLMSVLEREGYGRRR